MTAPVVVLHWLQVGVICSLVAGSESFSIQEGGLLTEDLKLQKWASPITVKGDVFVHKDATLTIAAGVVMRFAPGVMLAVNGTLKAEGLPDDRITMTRLEDPPTEAPSWPSDIRLVDDQSVAYGRLQLLYRGRWRGVCANSQNWTETDTDVACRQLGFLQGNFSFMSWARNDSRFMLYHRPDCTGAESSMLDCPRAPNIQIGSRICVQQKTIYLHCYGLAPRSTATANWWGLEFYNATLRQTISGSISIYESNSILRNVDILHAGVDPLGEPVPAVRASPTVPTLDGVTIRYSALDATNFTDINASTIVHNSDFELNRGHGLVVESRFGRIRVTDSRMTANSGNGIKAKLLDRKYLIIDEDKSFCKRINLGGNQMFPQVISGIPNKYTTSCDKTFRTKPGHIITFNVLEMDIEPDADAWLHVYDGKNAHYPRLAKIPVINGTMPQGLSSTKDYMYVVFEWTRPRNCPTLRDCVKFTIMTDSGPDVVPEFYVNNTRVHNNTQHGIFLENVRNKAVVNASSLSFNGYGAGLRVYGGAGDIQVNASNVTYNEDNGVNITYDGGWRVFNLSSFSHNYGNGVNVTLNETSVDNKTRLSVQQRTEVSQSMFLLNDGIGFRIGNYCREGNVVVNDSQFISNTGGGVEMESCYRLTTRRDRTNFTMGYNRFEANFGHAVKIAPMLNVVGRIANNTFADHPRYVLLIDNTDYLTLAREYTKMAVDYEVTGNRFTGNRGFYVANLRLTQGSVAQRLDFMFNRFLDNIIDGGGTAMTLNQRTRAHAVVIVSSSNVQFIRNVLVNPESHYEVATHLLDQSVTLHTKMQWWGTTEYDKIIPRIFDQSNRYNLARIDYHPVLRYDRVFENFTTERDHAPVEVAFHRGSRLGGRLYTTYSTRPNTLYHVDRDIDVMPEGRFTIADGTILEFENSIGMLVQGTVKAEGRGSNPVVFRLRNETTAHNHSLVRLGTEEGAMEGRLQVRPTEADEWGTVCNKGWTIVDASVVCQMLGLVVHPSDWRVYDAVPGPSSGPIWRSRVECTELDMDVTKCRADGREDHSCTHDQDVHVRCKKPTWAGIRFLAKASPSRLVHATVTQAGLMDPTAILYSAAIMIDYNVHTLEHLTVSLNMDTGIDILHNDIYSNAQLRNSLVSDNKGNGVIVRASFFTLAFCTLRNNVAGFEYNPSRTTYQGLQLRAGIHDPKVFDASLRSIHLANQAYVFVVTRETIASTRRTYSLEVTVDSSHRVVMDVLDYNPDTAHENVTVYDGRRSAIDRGRTRQWSIESDLADFPVEASGMALTIEWTVEGSVSGRFTFVLRSKPWNWAWPFAKLTVMNSTTEDNEKGVVTRHYNQPSNEFDDIFHRYRWETIRIYGVSFLRNRVMALHVPSITKYHELYLPTFEELQRPFTAAEITYELDSCQFKENGGGLLGEHNHVEFSNNMWIWQVTNNEFRENAGGFALELPLINLTFQELYNHSVDINDTVFIHNTRFEFRIDGFYCNSTIARNRFVANTCLKGCITITGTEKDIDIHDNEIFENAGKYIMELNMKSHTPYTRWVEAEVTNNNFKRNRKLGDSGGSNAPSSSPTSYTLGIKGLQNITVNRNLFANSLDYELVGGYASSSLDNYLDVRENWWGSSQQPVIREKIFDFDDWNSYAVAEYYPFLISDQFASTTSTLGKEEPSLDVDKPLGGRIQKSLRLRKRSEPYVIRSDLTIMPHASVYVESGVELQFYPNVGILVLGSLSMRGYADDVIKAGPVKRDRRQKRAAPSATAPKIKLVGGDTENEGFIQIYNATERRWALICDTNFNDETAEVACRTMGLESSNVIVERTRWYDIFVLGYPKMHEQVIEWFWRETLICDGTEDSIDQCRYKLNYDLNRCMERRDYVFVRCGPRNLADEFDYWGNIRFSTPEYEQSSITPGYSSLDYVDIYGAGMLHGERVAAIQSVHRTPQSNHVRITNCAWNGYDFIAPRDDFIVSYGTIKNNNGYGVGGLVLNGESNYDVPRSSFVPLVQSSIPYNVFGLVRMCTTEKLIYVHDRLLLYYKYGFESIDCIKIIRSVEPDKRIALRFLQLNLLSDVFHKNAVEMYNGEYFESELKIGEVTAETSRTGRAIKYETRKPFDLMGVRVTASAAHGQYGFIAEVVTLPLSPGWRPDLGPGNRQKVMDTDMTNNLRGGVHFMNVGELNPSVQVERCRMQHGGYRILNLTSPAIVSMYIQNSRLLTIANNYMSHNYGGVFINTTTINLATAIYSNITNNVMMYNSHGCMLHVEGHHFQGINIRNNYIARNNVSYRNLMSLFGVHLNFSSNIVESNVARTIINATVPKQVKINQRYTANTIYENEAIGGNKTTIFLRSAKFSFNENFLLNRLNKFEMVTYNRTKYKGDVYPMVDATNNWWGYGLAVFVSGRVMERRDDDYLIGVRYQPFHETNKTILQGRCYPGWLLHNKMCYRYMGGVAPYQVAYQQCKDARARIAWASEVGDRRYLGEVVASFQENYDEKWRVWVYTDWETKDSCSSLMNYDVSQVNCDLLLSYVCERDPYVSPSLYWRPIIITLAVVGGVLLIVIILVCCAVCKARVRKAQHFERRDSLRASLRSSRQSVMTNRSALMTDDMRLQRARRPPLRTPDHSGFDISGVTLAASSTDSIDKLKLDAHRPGTPGSTLDYLSTTPNETSSYLDSDLGPAARDYTPRADTSRSRWDYPPPTSAADYRQPPRLENEIANIMARPTFDNVLRNEHFRDDRSIDRLPMASTTDSPIAVGTPRRYVYPRPSLSRSAGNSLSSLDDRPKPKETAM